jgi:hypothetical protein
MWHAEVELVQTAELARFAAPSALFDHLRRRLADLEKVAGAPGDRLQQGEHHEMD